MKFPKIEDDKIFELLARDVMQIKLNTVCSVYGRKGQCQNGIDLYTSGENRIAIQCKDLLVDKTANQMMTIIQTEVTKLEGLKIPINQFWIATALNRDVQLQTDVELMNPILNNKCIIYIIFWEDIEEILSFNIDLIHKYYPIFSDRQSINYRAIISMGFFSQVFAEYIELMRLGRVDALSYCDMIENGIEFIGNINTQNSIRENLNAVRRYLNGGLSLVVDFKKENAYLWCQSIEQNLLSAIGTFDDITIQYFRIGQYLGCFDKNLNFSDSEPRQITEKQVNELTFILKNISLNNIDITYVINELNLLLVNDVTEDLNLRKSGIPGSLYNYFCNRI